jgi:hypothetical protein
MRLFFYVRHGMISTQTTNQPTNQHHQVRKPAYVTDEVAPSSTSAEAENGEYEADDEEYAAEDGEYEAEDGEYEAEDGEYEAEDREYEAEDEDSDHVFDWGTLSTSSPMEVQWAAFYSDCPHEIFPVTTGNRITMTYNLMAASAPLSEPQNIDTTGGFDLQLRRYSPFKPSLPTYISLKSHPR